MNKLKIALIGLGSMGRNHLKTIRNTPEVELVATVDPVNNNLDELSNIQQYDNIEDLIKNHTLDAAIIATPTSTHFEVAERLLNEKINLLVEKPIAKNSQEARSLYLLAHKNNCKLVVGHIERFNPAIQALLPFLKNEKIIHIEASRFSGYPSRIADVGVKLDLSIHDIDLMNLISKSKIKECYSLDSNNINDNDDDAVFIIKFFDGALATVRTSWLFPFRERKIKILTNERYFAIDLLKKKVDMFTNNENFEGYSIQSLDIDRTDALELQLKSFVKYIKTGDIGTLCSANDGAIALSYVEGVE
jgi:predicted dehydrogenase